MYTNINIEYAKAYTEVLEVINHMSKTDYEKIPKDIINIFQTNCDKEYKFKYDFDKKFEDQKLCKRTKLILAILFRDYWATSSQKEKILKMQCYERKILEEQKRKKYNLDNIFINHNLKKEVNGKSNENDVVITIYKESILKKIICRIKNFLFKKELK